MKEKKKPQCERCGASGKCGVAIIQLRYGRDNFINLLKIIIFNMIIYQDDTKMEERLLNNRGNEKKMHNSQKDMLESDKDKPE